jgi:Fungal trichothecene efflux pump (TRI12)
VQAGDGMCYQEMNLIHRVFWFSVPISVVVLIQLWFFLPLVKVSGNMKSKLKKIDYGGSLISLAATIFVLVSVSGGGVKYAWNSAIVIVMLTLGVVLYIVFILYEIYVARIPIMPSIPVVKTFLTGSVSFCNPVGCLNSLADFSRGHCLLWCLILPPHILPGSATPKHHLVWRDAPSPYHHANVLRYICWYFYGKVQSNFSYHSNYPGLEDIIPPSGQDLLSGLWDWAYKQPSRLKFQLR